VVTIVQREAGLSPLALDRPASDTGTVNTVMVVLRRGRDHKLYPVDLPLPKAEHDRLVGLSHLMRCGRGLSYRQAQRALAEQLGVRRSLGAIFRDVHHYECAQCIAPIALPPPPRARPQPWR
jgi:hypothetical protein